MNNKILTEFKINRFKKQTFLLQFLFNKIIWMYYKTKVVLLGYNDCILKNDFIFFNNYKKLKSIIWEKT